MNAEHTTQLRLLQLQAADTAIAQQTHRRSTLPALAEITDIQGRIESLHNDVVDAQTQSSDIGIEQRRLENEVEAVRTRTSRDEQRLADGGLPAKELSGLQHEITTLARRQGSLEDDLLEVMQQREEVDTSIVELQAAHSALVAELADLETVRDQAFVEIDAAIAGHLADRGGLIEDIPADLLALYERAREQGAGVGAAMLRQRRCEGCRIELSGSELASVRSADADAIVRCENCRRILIRTAESGL